MEVTKTNFDTVLPTIKKAIKQADFLAIDTELTGLSTKVTEHAFDTMAERYAKYHENCSKFLVIQFGLSCFNYDESANEYTHKDFNFYVFPRPHAKQAPDPKFMCQTSSLHFLASHGFDFNKTIRDGIPYLTQSQEEKLKDYLVQKHESEKINLANEANGQPKKENDKIDIPEEHQDFITEINNRVDDFMSNEAETIIHFDPCNSFLRKLIYQTVKQKHPTGIDIFSEKNEQSDVFITILKGTDEERLYKLEQQQLNDLNDVESAVGFRKVIDAISQSKKLTIGHNMFLDFLHIINQFVCPLPETWEEYKQLLHCVFPLLADTKVVASCEQLKEFIQSPHLSSLLYQLSKLGLPTIRGTNNFKCYSLSQNILHEAGYDAFITGVCYLGLIKKLASINKVQRIDHTSEVLKHLLNRIFTMHHYNIPHFSICGPDYEPSRNNVFYVSFPSSWRTSDLIELFSPYGRIYVNFLDDVSALIALKEGKPSVIDIVKKNLVGKSNSVVRVRTFNEYQIISSKSKSKAESSLLPKKRASSSLISSASSNEDQGTKIERKHDMVSTSNEGTDVWEQDEAGSSSCPPVKKVKSEDGNETNEVSSTALLFGDGTW